MKLREKMKRFWTLDVHNHEGFTLVELIIVIAILAILSTGAIAGYSAYVERANKTADQALVAEIKNALLLAYYSGELTGENMIILSVNGVENKAEITDDSPLDKAMTAAYGENWKEVLALKYSGWTSNAATVYADYSGSSFDGNEEKLLNDIQNLTEALKAFVDTSGTSFIGTDYTAFAQKYGIDVNNATEVANAASLYVAEQTKKVNVEAFVSEWTRNDGNSADVSSNNFTKEEVGSLGIMGALAAHYARAESMAAFVDTHYSASVNFTDANGAKITASQWLSSQQIGGADTDAVVAKMQEITNHFAGCLGSNYQDIIKAYGADDQAEQDARAYVSMMGAIVENSDVLLDNVNKDGNMYTDGTVEQMLTNFMSAGEYLNGAAKEGTVAIVASVNQNGYVLLIVGMGKE